MCECVRLGTENQVAEFEAALEQNKGNGENVMEVLQKTQNVQCHV